MVGGIILDDDNTTFRAGNTSGGGGMISSLALTSRFYHDSVSNVVDESTTDYQDVEQEVAAGLVKTINTSLPSSCNGSLTDVQGLQIAILSSSLSMALRCSMDIILEANTISGFQEDLLLALHHVSELFASWQGDIIIQQVVLSSIVKIANFVFQHVPETAEQLTEDLIEILKGNVTSNVRLDAAGTIVRFVVDKKKNASNSSVASSSSSSMDLLVLLSKVEEHASVLISTLITASLAGTGTKAFEYLFELAETSNILLTKMVKRRGMILVAVRDLSHEEEAIRELALIFCKAILNSEESVQSLSSNADLFIEGLTNSAENEPDPRLRLMAISLLRIVVSISSLRSECALTTLKSISQHGETDDEVVHAATGYCIGTRNCPFAFEMLSTVVAFTTFPYAQVRSEALATLEVIISDPACACLLLEETDMLESFGMIIQHGTCDDCTDAMNIARQLARSVSFHKVLCSHTQFLGAAVDLVARAKSASDGFPYGVELIVSLLSNKANTTAFLPFPHLLPWLVTFAATTKDSDFKQEIITSIVRLSEALLE